MAVRLLFLLPAIALVACGHVTPVRTTPAGVLAPEVSLGGPLANVAGGHKPLPLSTVGARYGVREGLDVGGAVHLTSLAFGVAGLDVGAGWRALREEGARPELVLSSRLYGFTDFRSFRPYLELTSAASYELGGRFALYLAPTAFVQTSMAPVLSLGSGVSIGFDRWALQLEARWYAPEATATPMAVDWFAPGGQGALGFVIGVRRRFGAAGGQP